MLLILLAVLPFLIAVGAFEMGYRSAEDRKVPLTNQADLLKLTLAELETRSELDRDAIARLTQDLAENRGAIDELERELAFYREVMAPEDRGGSVRLRAPRFLATDQPLVWEYQVIVQQGSMSDVRNVGDLRLKLFGRLAGEPTMLNLAELDAELETDALSLNFRYFQRFDGVLRLPAGFAPERVEMEVDIKKPRSDGVTAAHDWRDVIVYIGRP